MDGIFDAAIIGAGPAGCACATWLKQLGFSPLLIDQQAECGGIQLQNAYSNTWIPSSYAVSGKDVAIAMHKNVVSLKIDLHLETTSLDAARTDGGFSIDVIKKNDKHKFRSKYLVLAGGIIPKSGGFTERPGILIGSTQKTAATNFTGKRVAILGGGDNAFENYIFAQSGGAKALSIFSRSKPRAQRNFINKVPAKDVLIGPFDCNQEKNTVNGQHFDYIIVMFGYEVSHGSLLGLEPKRRPDGYVLTNAECQTSLDGVFAIGEITQRTHPCCVTAMADGIIAAKALQGLLEKE